MQLNLIDSAKKVLKKVKPNKPSLLAKVRNLAASQVGVKEKPAGSNMQKYGAWYRMNGVAWCAIFVSWVLCHSGKRFKYSYVPTVALDARRGKNGLKAIPAKRIHIAFSNKKPVMACFDWEHDGTPDHIGFVVSVPDANGNFNTIEGNTAVGNDSNGGQVMRRERNVSQVHTFVTFK